MWTSWDQGAATFPHAFQQFHPGVVTLQEPGGRIPWAPAWLTRQEPPSGAGPRGNQENSRTGCTRMSLTLQPPDTQNNG